MDRDEIDKEREGCSIAGACVPSRDADVSQFAQLRDSLVKGRCYVAAVVGGGGELARRLVRLGSHQ